MSKSLFCPHMIATLAELKNPGRLLNAADAGEIIVLTDHGKPRYELKKAAPRVDWDALEAEKENWLTSAEADELENAIARTEKALTDATVP